MGQLVQQFIDRISNEVEGSEPVGKKMKIGSGKNKRFIKIRRLIHIQPKRPRNKLEIIGTRKIDWSHRWLVRGHWRTLGPGKVGKDRNGVYCIPGKTWVTDGVKGPDNKPIVHKTRFVEK
jgi:hypothetical protein